MSSGNRASILRDFAGLESPERLCGPLPGQTIIMPCLWDESGLGAPSGVQNLLAQVLPKQMVIYLGKDRFRSFELLNLSSLFSWESVAWCLLDSARGVG